MKILRFFIVVLLGYSFSTAKLQSQSTTTTVTCTSSNGSVSSFSTIVPSGTTATAQAFQITLAGAGFTRQTRVFLTSTVISLNQELSVVTTSATRIVAEIPARFNLSFPYRVQIVQPDGCRLTKLFGIDLPSTCQGRTVLTSLSGTFSDRATTQTTYGDKSDCFWLIQPTGTVANSVISLMFNKFNTEKDYDFVRVYDGADTNARLIGTFSGTTIPAMMYSTGKTLLVRFTTDVYVSAEGWKASYSTQPAPLPTYQSTTLTALSGTFSDRTTTSATYNHNTDSYWLIQPAETVTGSTIALDFQSFDTEKNYDVVQVYDGADTNARLLGRFSGGEGIPLRLHSSGKTVLVRFTTDRYVAAAGWSLEYWTQPQVLIAPFKWFGATDSYSQWRGSYLPNDRRSWLIRPPGARRIALRFGEFNTAAGTDEVRVYDGADTTARLLGRFSGSSVASVPIFSSGGTMLITFSSDRFFDRDATGWNAYYVAERDSVFLDVQKEDRQIQEIIFPPTALGDSTVQQYQLTASSVRGNLVLTASAGYRLSRSPQGVFTQTLTIEPDGDGFVPYMGIFVQAAPTARGNLNGSVTHRVGGNSLKTITLRTPGYTFSYWEPTNGPNLLSLNRSSFTNIGNTIFIGTADGIYQTTSNGSIWQPIAFAGQLIVNLTAIDTLLFAFLDSGRIHRSLDKGKSWENVGIWDSPDTTIWKGYKYLSSLVFKDSDIFQLRNKYLPATRRSEYSLFRSKDGGRTWVSVLITKNYPSFFITSDKILRFQSDKLLRSADNGTTWEEDKDFTARPSVRAVSGRFVFEVFISDIIDSLRRTSDNGKTWVTIGKNLYRSVRGVGEFDFYALMEGRVVMASTYVGLYISQDSGETFQRINHTIGRTIGYFRAFSKDRDLYCEVDGLIYRSTNLGLNWSLVMNGISGAPTSILVAAGQTPYSAIALNNGNIGLLFRTSNVGEVWQGVSLPRHGGNIIAVRGDLFMLDRSLSRLRSGSSNWESITLPRDLSALRHFTDGNNVFCIFGNRNLYWSGSSYFPNGVDYQIWKFDVVSGEWKEYEKIKAYALIPLNTSLQILIHKNKLFFQSTDDFGGRPAFASATLTENNTRDTVRLVYYVNVWPRENHPGSRGFFRSPFLNASTIRDSVDSGWRRNTPYQIPPDSVRFIARHDTSLYVATNHGILRSLDNGETWQPTGFWYSTYYLCSSESGLIALTYEGVYIFHEGVWRKNVEGLPKNTRPTMVTAIDNYMYAVFPPELYQVVHRARINPPSTVARAELTIPDTLTALAGEEIDIPIKVSAAKHFFGDSTTIALTLRFNASVLQPLIPSLGSIGAPEISTEDGQTMVRIRYVKVRGSQETIRTLRCRVMLGNSVATPIFMTNISSDPLLSATLKEVSVVATGPGIFTLRQFSEVGGTRSFRSAEAASTLVSLPNPVQDALSLKYFVVEEGTTTITVVDVTGRTLKTLESGTMHQGWHTKTFPVTDLPSGTYFLMMQTPTALKVQRMEVQR
ncbi:MAG: T9SS C-terminal target domain-containing protein [Candidatus Kapaibacterium sp.]|nr:MAG: T9SS C-terminal target domain-containing protein [Candidatus Kapabacteria bacterium]